MSQMRENLKSGVEAEEAHVLSPAHSQQQHQHRNLQPRNHRIVGVVIAESEIPLDVVNTSGEGVSEVWNEDIDNDQEVYNENDNPEVKLHGHGVHKNEAHRQRAQQIGHRKRKNSVKGGGDGNYVPPYKKNRFRRQTSVLPSKFLLGGNIHDPLNLASLADEKINAQLNKDTPVSSPVPTSAPDVTTSRRHNSVSEGTITFTTGHKHTEEVKCHRDVAIERKNSNEMGTFPKKHKNRKHRSRRKNGRKRTDSECSVTSLASTGDEDGLPEEEFAQVLRTSFEQSEDEVELKDTSPQKSVPATSFVDRNTLIQSEEKESVVKGDAGKQEVKDTTVQVIAVGSSGSGDKKPELPKNGTCENEGFVMVEAATHKKQNITEKPDDNPKQPEGEDCEKPLTPGRVPVTEAGKLREELKSRRSSEYVPLSSYYAPSPFILDVLEPGDSFEVRPFESPSLTNYCCSASTDYMEMEPFSPPPTPEIPPFMQRMQMYANSHLNHGRPQSILPAHRQNLLHRQLCRRRFRHHKWHKLDPIVSPVIPQHGSRRKHHHVKKNPNGGVGGGLPCPQNAPQATATSTATSSNEPQPGPSSAVAQKDSAKMFRKKDQIFQFGNYSRYYGYRTCGDGEDGRLRVFKREWFDGKDVLDVGCNIGHITLSLGRDFGPRRVHGIDIDKHLISVARKNVKHYMVRDPNDKDVVFPNSLPLMFGALQPPPRHKDKTTSIFPYNVFFSHENYVLENDEMLENVQPEYDVILLLSITKWIHLNNGDDGLKRLFRRCFLHLRHGGKLILEPQPWSSYKRKKKLTEKIFETYQNIHFYPDYFQEFLIKTVGFASVDAIGPPAHHSKGFQRPLLVFTKAIGSPASSSVTTAPVATATSEDTGNGAMDSADVQSNEPETL